METNKIICGDGVEFLRTLREKSVSLILTDPPYGIGLKYDIYNDTSENWIELICKTIPEIKRVATMAIMPCCRIAMLPYIYRFFAPDWIMCWYKGSPGHRSYVGFNDWEPLLVYGKNKGVCMHDHFQTTEKVKMGTFGHPCPKPLSWATWLIARATKPGDLVVDPFCGSGTVCLAAAGLGRKYIGVDISETYCNIARERIANDSYVTK